MEKNLELSMDNIMSSPGVTGCVIADKQGLCLLVRGKASVESSGILTAISHQAKKLEPQSKNGPIVILESDQTQCILKSNDDLMVAVYKSIT